MELEWDAAPLGQWKAKVGDKIHIALKGLAEGGTSFFPDRPSPKSTRRAEVSADIAKVALPAAGKAAVLLLQR